MRARTANLDVVSLSLEGGVAAKLSCQNKCTTSDQIFFQIMTQSHVSHTVKTLSILYPCVLCLLTQVKPQPTNHSLIKTKIKMHRP